MKKLLAVSLILACTYARASHMTVVAKKHHHVHTANCEHTGVWHMGHIDYLHDGHLHHSHGDHFDEHSIEDTKLNTTNHFPLMAPRLSEILNLQKIPHDDHTDYIYEGRLVHAHKDHVDDHGPIKLAN